MHLNGFLRLISFYRAKRNYFKSTANGDYAGVIYLLYGYLNKSKGNYKDAVKYFERACKEDLRTTHKSISAEALCEVGKIYGEHFNQPATALQYFHKAIKYSTKQNLSWIYDFIGNIDAGLGKYDLAYRFYLKAFSVIGNGIDEKNILLHTNDYTANNSIGSLLNIVLDEGDLYFEKYKSRKQKKDLEQALLIYKTADRLVTKIKNDQGEEEAKLFWRSYTTRHLYEHAIEACYLGDNSNDGIYFFEKSRAVLLEDQLRQGQHIGEMDILKLSQAKKNLSRLENAYRDSKVFQKPDINTLKELFLNREQLTKTENVIRSHNPLFQVFLDSSFININDIRNGLLKDHQAALEFFNGDSAVYTLQITSQQVLLNRIKKTAFDSTLKKYNNYVFDPAKTNAHFDDYIKTASSLTTLIFGNHPPPPGRIIISTDGQSFPFEALITGIKGRQIQYFLNDHAVSYTYSLRFLMSKFMADSAPNHKDFIGVAPVRYASSFALSSLSGSDQSLKNISAFLELLKI